eukprot:TRINITY_DN1759_c0_g1_i2.p1 TRINITY_DN1759_c0_g1~~TRINITY_DN1759_c0_g1_i2.p1  ORF type:complete len:442 (-),score=111.84 TRINITY_DN1759_c0_g1_i2:50-1375(-)
MVGALRIAAALCALVCACASSAASPEQLQVYISGDELPMALSMGAKTGNPSVLYAKPELGAGSAAGKPEVKTAGTSTAFVCHALALLVVVFALMYVYSRTYAIIEAATGIKLTHICCIVYACLSISIDLSIKNAAEAYGGHFPFNPACGVIVVEYCKFVVSAVLFAAYALEARSTGEPLALPRSQDVMWLSVPAAIYAMNNLIVFQAIRSTPLATFGVVRETMLIWNALIWTATFGHPLSSMRWLAIAGIFLGCSLNQIPKMLSDDFTPGVFWAVLLAFSNAAGAVANEYAMKQRAQLDINLQNAILYTLCGTFVLVGLACFQPAVVSSPATFFEGFVPECWQVIILQVFTGLAVSRILKYVEAVTKTIVAAIRGPGVIVIGAVLFKTSLGASEMLATVIVCASCYLFLSQGPLLKPAPAKKAEASETDRLIDDVKGLAKV